MRKLWAVGAAAAVAGSLLACSQTTAAPKAAVAPQAAKAATAPNTFKPTSYPKGYNTWECGNTSNRMVLTFDDDPGRYGYDSVLKMGAYLKSKNIRAMFFLDTKHLWAANRGDVVPTLRRQGHYVGNHSYNHPSFYKVSNAEVERQIKLGVDGNLLRPPHGDYNATHKEIARKLGYRVCTWHKELSTHDWDKGTGPNKLRSTASIRNIVKKASHNAKANSGGVILGHLWTNYPAAVPGIISDMHKQGYLFCRNRGPVPADGTVPFPLKCT